MEHQQIEAAAPAAARFMVERAPLAKAVDFVARNIVERRNSIPILSNVMLAPAACGGLDLIATDLDIMARVTIPADAVAFEVPGTFTADAATLADITKKADGHTFDVREDVIAEKVTTGGPRRYSAGRAVLSIGRARSNVPTLPHDEFPMIADPRAEPGAAVFELPGHIVADVLGRIAFAMSKEEARYYLNGVALQLRTIDDRPSLVFVATNGNQLARVAIDVPDGADALPDIILPRKLVTVLQRALKARPAADVAFLVSANGARAAIMIGDLYLVAKMIDGAFPQWERVDPTMTGEELQSLAFIDLDPSIRPADVAAFSKALGACPAVAGGASSLVFTSPDHPGFIGVATREAEDRNAKATYGFNGAAGVKEYAEELARKHGFPVDSLYRSIEPYTPHGEEPRACEPYLPMRLRMSRGMIQAATFGEQLTCSGEERREVPCYETFTMREEIVAVPEQWADGSFSIIFPREKRAMAATVSFGEIGADEIPLRTLANGTLELSAEAVRRLAGEIDDLPRVDIPRFTFRHGEIVAIDGIATDGTGRRYHARSGEIIQRVVKGKGKGSRVRDSRLTDREAIAHYCHDPVAFMARYEPEFYDAPAAADVAPVAASQPPEEPEIEAPEFEPVELPEPEPMEEPGRADEPDDIPQPEEGRLAALESAVAALQARVEAMAAGTAPTVPSEREAALAAENEALRAEIARLRGKRVVTGVRLAETRRALREARFMAEGHDARARIFAGHYRAARMELARIRPFIPEAERAPKVAPGVRAVRALAA